eukprot:scaffold107563_cov52-Cyclotella_meneghiniana.AAC.1
MRCRNSSSSSASDRAAARGTSTADVSAVYRYQRTALVTLAVLLLQSSSNAFVSQRAPQSNIVVQFKPRISSTFLNIASNRKIIQWRLCAESSSDDEEEDEPPIVIDGFDLDDNDLGVLTRETLSSMTVPQLKQQLRLRGKPTSGKKAQLIDRLLDQRVNPVNTAAASTYASDTDKAASEKEAKRIAEAKARGADIVDVTEYVEAEQVGKSFRSSDRNKQKDDAIDVETEDTKQESSPEIWGEDARIVQDYEGRSVVVDGLSRTVIEYKGSNNTIVQAYVVGSRDALAKFLMGGQQDKEGASSNSTAKKYASLEEQVYDIQRKREVQNMKSLPRDDLLDGIDDDNVPMEPIARDPGDWGVWTPTGAQLSATEVQGVLLLSDVYGPFTENTQSLADKIAFECQPVVVLVPDLFRGRPWIEKPIIGDDGIERNKQRQTYEEWRASHPDRRVDVDIRAAAAVLRERYDVSCIAVWGTCYGGGRALEAASGWYHDGSEGYYNDAFSDRPPPPHVDPVACIAWYPTQYNAKKLFGKNHEGFKTFENGDDRTVAVMAVFAENDTLPGATKDDAALLKDCLDDDSRVKDVMVKVFPNQNHGFAHNTQREYTEGFDEDRFVVEDGYGGRANLIEHEYNGDAEVACLLSTAWMETYTRIFLPTVGAPVRHEEDKQWSQLDMNGSPKEVKRNVRQEIEDAVAKFEPPEVDYSEVKERDSSFLDAPPEELRRLQQKQEEIRQKLLEKLDMYDIDPNQEDEVFLEKLQQLHADGVLNPGTIEAFFDGDESKLGW